MCAAFVDRSRGLPGARVVVARFAALEPPDCFVAAGNAVGRMTAGIDAAAARFFGGSRSRPTAVPHGLISMSPARQAAGVVGLVGTREGTDLPSKRGLVIHAAVLLSTLAQSNNGP